MKKIMLEIFYFDIHSKKNHINSILALGLSLVTNLLGGFDNLIKALVFVIILDYLTGILRAIYHKELNSRVGLKGIIKKVFYFAIISLAFLLDNLIGADLFLRNSIIYFFIANEGLSILENYTACELPMIPKIKELLIQLRDEGR